MRCLTLADELYAKFCDITFISRDLPGNLFSLLDTKAYRVCKLAVPSDNETLYWQEDAEGTSSCIEASGKQADWVVVDHYELDKRWESSLREHTNKIMVIDDLANRTHNCDLLLDQNYYMNMECRYENLVPVRCQKFLGPQYLLLRNEFEKAITKQEKRNGSVKRIIMFFGGSDASHETLKALEALYLLKENNIRFDIVVGQSNGDYRKIKNLVENMPAVSFHCQINNMAELMIQADLAVIAAGGSTWETCYLSLPTITVMAAQNQFEAISSLEKEGVLWNLGWYYEVTSQDIADAIEKACLSPDKLIDMGKRAKQLVGSSRGLTKILDAMKDYKIY